MKIIKTSVRDAVDEWHIECTFDDGQKWAPITVDKELEWLADSISRFLNNSESKSVRD